MPQRVTTDFSRRDYQALAIVLLLAIVLRAAAVFAIGLPDVSGGDFPLFDRMAKNLIHFGDFRGEPAATYGSPYINPGFALWLAALYLIFGSSSALVTVSSILFGAVLVLGSYLFAARIFGKRAGLVSALVTALFPTLVILTVERDKTLLYATLFFFTVFFFWMALENGRFGIHLLNAALAGIFLGLASLTESISFYVPAVLGLWLAGLIIFKPSAPYLSLEFRRAALLFLMFLLAYSLTLTPWAVRNVVVSVGDTAPVISKGELRVLSPQAAAKISKQLGGGDIILSGLKRMLAFPYGLWLLDTDPQEDAIVYKTLPGRILKGERFSFNILAILAVKTFATIIYWGLLVTALYATFKFRVFGSFIFSLFGYQIMAAIGFVALSGGDFNKVSFLSVFVVPFFPLFAVLASGLFNRQINANL